MLVTDGLITESTYALDDLISEICEDSGLSASEVDATDLSAITVDGYAVTRPMPAREAIKPLQQAYWFDVAEFGGKINFVARGGASVDSIPEDDLGATYGDNVEAFVATRIQDADLPKRVTIKYLDPDLDGQQNTQYAARITTQATAEQMIELPLLLDADSAAQVAEVILYDAWQTREPVKFQIPAETYYALNPSDVVDVTYGSRTYSIRLTRIDFEIPGVMKCEGTVEDASIYTPVATGHAPSTQTDALQLPGPTVGKVLDIALISDIDQQAGFYIAATGPLSGWPGCYFMMSTDGGSSYETIAIIKDRTIMGRADTVLAMGEDTVIDTDSSLTVTLVRPDDSLSGITETQLLNLSNLALVGDEIVAFQNATNTSGSTWDLDTFLRSQRGTDWAMDDHAADEDFIVLGENIQRVALADDYIGSEIFYKFVTLGQPADLATEYSFTYQGNAYKPYSVSHLEAEDAGSGNWDISWVRRTRIGGAWRDLIDVPLMEDTESYTVEVWSGGSLSTTTDVTSESATV
ncbi:MAG TPA: phage tail protein, partial [Thiohalobacter sp.]|nr:phage tail protein [Thiohalobacter sp.]